VERSTPAWNARDCCGIPIGWKHEQWRKKPEKWVATLTPEQRALWYVRVPPGWMH
jgi:hypothetical protein